MAVLPVAVELIRLSSIHSLPNKKGLYQTELIKAAPTSAASIAR
jgi:hypothetical protein